MDTEGKILNHLEQISDQFIEMNLDHLNKGFFFQRFHSYETVVIKCATIQK